MNIMSYLSLFIIIFILAVAVLYSLFLIGVFWGAFWSAPFVPTNKRTGQTMLKLARIGPNDTVYDLGSGDGRLVFEAAKKAKIAVGFEISLPIYFWSRLWKFFGKKKGSILCKNFFHADLRDADIVFCYLLGPAMKRLVKKFNKELKKGCRIVSHGFEIPGWEPTTHIPRSEHGETGTVRLYVKE